LLSDPTAAKIDPLRKTRSIPTPGRSTAATGMARPDGVAPKPRQARLDMALDYLSASLNPQEVIARLMQRAVKALQADRASLVMLEDGGWCTAVGAVDLGGPALPIGTRWRITSTRPSNHPQRRLAALSILVREWTAFRKSLAKHKAAAVGKFLGEIGHPFWKLHYTLVADPSPNEMALIGESRGVEILANAIFPFWSGHESASPARADLWVEYTKLPARLSNRRLETAATRLFGDEQRAKDFLKTVAHQQGLLQIYEDFCLQDNSDCAQCPFPEQMQKWK